MNGKNKDIIAAIATPAGRGAISCVRLSGNGSAEMVKELTDVKGSFEHAKMVSCKFDGRIKDKIMAVVFLNGKSYTGEESAELYFHGGKYLTEQALLSVIDKGARIAEAGEFTRRAFLNGKIDLTQAEGIGDLIDGDNLVSLEAAYEQSEGKTRKSIDFIYDKAAYCAAKAEVSIDYPEEDIEEQTREELIQSIEEIKKLIKKETDGFGGGRIKREGAKIAIVGKTNAGKSTLFNTLLNSERAIVSDEEGTTRDTIEEKIIYKGAAFVLTDTAGIRETESKAEQMGIERSKLAQREADAVVRVVKYEGKNIKGNDGEITVVNYFNECGDKVKKSDSDVINLNAKTGEGTELLKEEIYRRVKDKTKNGGSVNNLRQYSALTEAYDCLTRATEAAKNLTLDCVCADLHGALTELGNITGRNASDSIIDEIFSHFCVGK